MRPLRLTMTGFGPYRENTVIDMESLGRGGLYLITGDTGAGKTFIFDAITYALYGDMSGSGRDIKSVRSQYSREGEKTEVELVFEYYGKKYTVTRNPEYSRAKKSGEGFTKQTAGAVLIKPDGSVAEGSSRVTEEIRNILGIDRGQFCNIVMIAQGEFRKVLNASTEERQKLFRKLFNTHPYSRLSDELKELNRKNQEKYNDALHAVSLCLSSVSCGYDEELSARLDEMRERSENETTMYEEICGLLASIIKAGEERSASAAAEISETEERLTEANTTIALAKEHRKNLTSLDDARKAVPALENDIVRAKQALDTANGKKTLIDKLENEAALTDASIDSYDELDSIRSDKAGLEKGLETMNARLASAREETEALKKELADSEKLLDELGTSGEDLIKITGSIEKASDRISLLETLVKEIDSASELSEDLKKKQGELEPLLADAEMLESRYSNMLTAYMREQAGILAASLEEGKPCPVCGSVEHPAPAELDKDAPAYDELEAMKTEAEASREKASRKAAEAHTAKGNLDAVMEKIRAEALRETGTELPEETRDAANKEILLLKESLAGMRKEEKELREKTAKKKELDSAVPGLRGSLEERTSMERNIEKERNAADASLAAVKAAYHQIRKDLAYDSKEEAERSRDTRSAEAKKLREDIEKALGEFNDALSQKRVNDAKIIELEKVVAGYEAVDEEAAALTASAAAAEKKALTEISIQTATELKSAAAALESVRSCAEELEHIRREHEMLDSLSRTANGSVPGKERITLESYVQSFYFDRIIRHANIRLRMMSDGQYEFVRSDEPGDKRHLSGLDLSVLDNYSGTERPVNTLSGGESFMASLSLALGLSDEVQSSAGGIRLETMFVDEGFGSLDSETLEKAVRTLTELSDEDRLVGIISHVDALKSRIDRQIVVTKNREAGSKAEVVI